MKKKKKKSVQERIESLVFYGTGDEAYELFTALCRCCYALRYGPPEWQEQVCAWAEECAAISRADYENWQGDPDSPHADKAKGYYCD